MKKYTIISFCFGNYDILREPAVIDPDAEYIYVTDQHIPSANWKVIVDERLAKKDPLYASYYVRHHPFEYAETEIAVVVDASIRLNDSIAPIVAEFDAYNAEYSILETVYRTDEHKIDFWENVKKSKPSRISDTDIATLRRFIKRMGQENWKGAIGQAFVIYRNTPIVRRFSRHVWRYLMALGHDGKPNRIDEVVIHKLLNSYKDRMELFILSMQVVQSTYMTYYAHGTYTPVKKYKNYDQCFYLCNLPVSPIRFDRGISFPRTYYCNTEAMLLTKYLTPDDLREWLDHHLYKVKFDRVHVFDNSGKLKDVCDSYGYRVSYERVYGHPRQYKLYDSYVNVHSSARWIMPIDDDEFLWLDGFDSVKDAIEYYHRKLPHMMMLGVRWKHLFPEKFHSERTGKVLDYCTEENTELATKFMHLGDRGIKTIVERYGEVHYEETWENPAGGHVPKHTCFLGAVMCDGSAVLGCGIQEGKILEDERIRLLHCRYRGYSEWMKKSGECRTVCDSYPREKNFEFNAMLDKLD